jgi:putative ABC transport system permease protein
MTVLLEAWGNDIRQATRRIARAPGLSVVVIVTLALSIAANTTIFSLLKPTVLRKLPTPDPDALVSIAGTDAKTGVYSAIHLATLDALKPGQQSFSALSAFVSSVVRVDVGGATVEVGVEGVAADYFTVLQLRPAAGRLLGADDDPLRAIGVLSERLAARLFGDTASAVGRTIVADTRPIEIVGVVADNYTGLRMDGGNDLFVPLQYLRSLTSGDPTPRAQMLIGRLVPGQTLEAARAEVLGRWPGIQAGVAPQLPAPHQAALNAQRIAVESLSRGFSGIRDLYGRSLTFVMVLAAALLAVGCVNLSSLMLARALTRQQEFAIRRALGVTRARLFQLTIIDGLLFSALAFLVALPISWWASRVLTSMVSVGRVISIGDTTPDLSVIAAGAAVSALAGIVISLWPARRAQTLNMEEILKGRGLSHRIRSARVLLFVQVALSMVLVVGAGLFMSTLANLYANDVQPREHPILFTRLTKNPDARGAIVAAPHFQQIQERLAAIAGVDRASLSSNYPAYLGFFGTNMPTEPIAAGGGIETAAFMELVTPGFFDTYGIALLRGRDFTWSDLEASPRVAIVNDALARKLAPSGEVLGTRVSRGAGAARVDLEIVGVVADAAMFNIQAGNVPVLFRPIAQDARAAQFPMAHVRITGDVAAVQRAYTDAIASLGTYFVRGIFTMDSWVANAVVEQRLIAGMASFAAFLAVALAAVGLFGMLAYSVSSRSREIGIRVSVGASEGEVLRMIVAEGLAVVIPGVLIGIPLALGAAWVVRSRLYGVAPTDPATLVVAALTFIVVAGIASWLPARRASRIEPVEALRQE